MRSRVTFCLIGLVLAVVASRTSSGEVVRTLKAEVATDRVSIENLAGVMRVTPGSGNSVVVTATVHAQDKTLAAGFRLDQRPEEGGTLVLLHYPLEGHRHIRYPDPRDRQEGWFDGFFSGSRVDYEGHRVLVSHSHGPLLYADVEVAVPSRLAQARFRNAVGLLKASGLTGKLRFDIGSADADLADLDGDIAVRGTSGDVRGKRLRGGWSSDLSSGDVDLDDVAGETLRLEASSGDIVLRNVRARHLTTDTSSGDVRIVDADLEDLETEASSGDLVFEERGDRLARIRARASSGDVTLRLARGAAFDARIDQTSGDLMLSYGDAEKIERGDRVVGARRGSGGVEIDVRTTSGDCTIGPR